jgi:hypothetical protein
MNGPLARHTHPQPRLRLFLAHAFPAAGAGRLLAPPCLAGVALNRPARPPALLAKGWSAIGSFCSVLHPHEYRPTAEVRRAQWRPPWKQVCS